MMKRLYELVDNFFKMLNMSDNIKQKISKTDILCLQLSLKKFLQSGKKDDAFSVYFCFSEIFNLFGQGYDNTKILLETLSDHEYHSGELLAKHRDHYSHSVYVFAIGLVIYAFDSSFRKSYLSFYKLKNNTNATFNFLKFWGLVSLFHDIGYPFELVHEQIKIYIQDLWGKDNKNNPYVSYGNFKKFIKIEKNNLSFLEKYLPNAIKFKTYNDLLAYGIHLREGYDIKDITRLLTTRIIKQPKFLDHAYFSAIILAKMFISKQKNDFDQQYLDALTAILLHNSLNKYDILNSHSIDINEHPLSYLLILCDELQCFDRYAYGKISKKAPLAYDFQLEISDNNLNLCYTFDSYLIENKYNKNYLEFHDGTFLNNLKSFISSSLKINIITKEIKKKKRAQTLGSDDNFISICELAKKIHSSFNEHCLSLTNEYISEDFGNLDLEFKLSNIEQAKSYAYKLEQINCLFSRKDLDYPIVDDFNQIKTNYKNNIEFLCREEHVRWVKEKLALGWKYGTDYKTNKERNNKKIHKDLVPYELLSSEEKSKDELMVTNMLKLLNRFDSNIKIYNYKESNDKILEIAGTGHRFFKEKKNKLKKKIRTILEKYSQSNTVVVRTCLAYGADQLITEVALELGLSVKANIPMPIEQYIESTHQDVIFHGLPFTKDDELKMRHLLAQCVVCKVISDPQFTYLEASKYLIEKCQILIALWDGKEMPLVDNNGNSINRGGTYDCIKIAKEQNKKIICIDCHR